MVDFHFNVNVFCFLEGIHFYVHAKYGLEYAFCCGFISFTKREHSNKLLLFHCFFVVCERKKIIIHSSKRLVRALWHGLGETKT